MKSSDMLSRAQGCLLGQLAGDSLGSLVEFQTSKQILKEYPNGVHLLSTGGTWGILAGQPTDDSELALLLARMLVSKGTYEAKDAKKEYVFWLNSNPFDCGHTTRSGLSGNLSYSSQANGAMMRVSPLGIFGANHPIETVANWAMEDSRITHPHQICQQANALYCMAISTAVKSGISANNLYDKIVSWAKKMNVEDSLFVVIQSAETSRPADYFTHQGWVLIAFQNALWQLLHSNNLENAVVDTVMQGGDTDTNAAICGSLLGAVYGRDAIPSQWLESILSCRPLAGEPHVKNPRPECFWPVDALQLSEKLIHPKSI